MEMTEICGEACNDGTSTVRPSQTDLIGWDRNVLDREWGTSVGHNSFIEFNQNTAQIRAGGPTIYGPAYDPPSVNEFIKQASFEEHKNQNQVIVYHGETMGVWLLQVLARQLKYPHATEWLPLRFDGNLEDADADSLKHLSLTFDDHSPIFTRIGLAAHVNLLSTVSGESAASALSCRWNAFSGIANLPSYAGPFSSFAEALGIPENQRESVIERLTAILQIVGSKMKWRSAIGEIGKIDYRKLFSSLNSQDFVLIDAWGRANAAAPQKKGVGVILQILMPPELATKYSYASAKHGTIKNEPFLDYYKRHKNRLDDDGQLRIAMGHPFTRYPSTVKMKALSPIFQERELMQLIQKMMNELVTLIQPLIRPSNRKPFSFFRRT